MAAVHARESKKSFTKLYYTKIILFEKMFLAFTELPGDLDFYARIFNELLRKDHPQVQQLALDCLLRC